MSSPGAQMSGFTRGGESVVGPRLEKSDSLLPWKTPARRYEPTEMLSFPEAFVSSVFLEVV